MKKKLLVFLTIFALVLSMTSLLAQAAEDAEVTVTVNEDGTITVTATGTFDENDWVGIYKQGDTIDPGNGGVASLVWWYLREGEEITYPGENEGITVESSNRVAELTAGAGSALAPGDYYAVVLGGESSYEVFSEEFEFTIPEETEETPTEAPATAEPTPEVTEEPTESPTTAPATAKTTPGAATAAPTQAPDADSESDNTVLIIVCIVAAVIIIAAIIVIVAVKKKKK